MMEQSKKTYSLVYALELGQLVEERGEEGVCLQAEGSLLVAKVRHGHFANAGKIRCIRCEQHRNAESGICNREDRFEALTTDDSCTSARPVWMACTAGSLWKWRFVCSTASAMAEARADACVDEGQETSGASVRITWAGGMSRTATAARPNSANSRTSITASGRTQTSFLHVVRCDLCLCLRWFALIHLAATDRRNDRPP